MMTPTLHPIELILRHPASCQNRSLMNQTNLPKLLAIRPLPAVKAA